MVRTCNLNIILKTRERENSWCSSHSHSQCVYWGSRLREHMQKRKNPRLLRIWWSAFDYEETGWNWKKIRQRPTFPLLVFLFFCRCFLCGVLPLRVWHLGHTGCVSWNIVLLSVCLLKLRFQSHIIKSLAVPCRNLWFCDQKDKRGHMLIFSFIVPF